MLKQVNKFGAYVSAFVVGFGTVMLSGEAYAAAGNGINSVVDTAGKQLINVGDLVNIACYGGGAVLTGTGLLNFKKHVDSPSQNELRKAIGPGVVGVALLAFPSVAGMLNDSLFSRTNVNVGYDNNAFQATF